MTTQSNWFPPDWRTGLDEDGREGYNDTPWTVEEVAAAVKQYQEQGYLTSARRLTAAGLKLADSNPMMLRSIEDAAHNERLLRDAWNTAGKAWILAARFLPEHLDFVVDPMWNPGTEGLPGLRRKLDGLTPKKDGEAIDPSRVYDVLANLKARKITPTRHEGFPLNWRGRLTKGRAPAAVNGAHSRTAKWLPLCDAYGQEEFCAAFVPYAGDRWLWEVGFRAPIVIHLGRVRCAPPPGLSESSPRGPSLVLLWVPPTYTDDGELFATLPEHTQRVLKGESLRIPYHLARNGVVRDVVVTPGRVNEEVDLGMTEIEGRA